MGLFDFMGINSDDTPNPTNTIEVGREAMKYFHNENSKFENYSMPFDQLLSTVAGRGGSDQQVGIFLDSIGSAINSIREGGFLRGGGDVKSAMENLANKSQGQVPTQASFFKALSDQAAQPSFIDAVSAVSIGTANEIGKGAVAVGNSVIESGKLLATFLPVLLLGAVAFIIYKNAKRAA